MVERIARDERPASSAEIQLRTLLPANAADELHELRVRIPVDLHRQLLSLKVLRGHSLAETVSAALDKYFAEARAAPPQASLGEKVRATP